MADVQIRGEEDVYLLVPLTDLGSHWLWENTPKSSWKWISGALALPRRFAGPTIDCMVADGLEVDF